MGTTDAAKLAWMENLAARAQAAAGMYMFSGADVAAIVAAAADFAAAMTLATQPTTRNKGTIASKNDVRATSRAICAQYARMVKYNMGIDDQAKIDAGITPPTTASEPRPCPVSAPGLGIVAATNGAQTLNYNNPLDPSTRRKPIGADGVILYRAIAEAPVTDIEQAQF